jgi:hypothetical protein
MTSTALAVKEVEFNGDILKAAQDQQSQKIYVAVKWVCNGIGLSDGQSRRQVENVSGDEVLKQGIANLRLPTNSGYQDVLCIEVNFLPLWLAKIHVTPTMKKENPILTKKLIEYQLKAKDVLAAAFVPQYTNTTDGTAFELLRLVKEMEKNLKNLLTSDRNPITTCSNQAFKRLTNASVQYLSRRGNMKIGTAWKIARSSIKETAKQNIRLDEIAQNPLLRLQMMQDIINVLEEKAFSYNKETISLPLPKMKNKRNEKIIKMRSQGKKVREIAKKYNLSCQQIYQILKKA